MVGVRYRYVAKNTTHISNNASRSRVLHTKQVSASQEQLLSTEGGGTDSTSSCSCSSSLEIIFTEHDEARGASGSV